MGPLLTTAAYVVLVVLWTICLVVYVRYRRAAAPDTLVSVLIGVLALDAFKNVVESAYFGTLWGARFGFLPAWVGAPLENGFAMAIPKVLNVVVVTLIIIRVAGGFLPRELRRRTRSNQEEVQLRRELEDSLAVIKESEGRLQSMLDRTNDVIVFWRFIDDDLILESINAAGRTTLGFDDNVIGTSASEIAPPEFYTLLMTAIETGTPQRAEDGTIETRQGRRDVIRQVVPLPDNDGVVRRVVSFTHDITALRERQAVEEAGTRLESLGILAGGIAHDFNNLLAVLRADVAQAADATRDEQREDLHAALAHANTTIDRARELVVQLLAMAGKRAPVTAAVDLGAVVMDTVRLLRPSVPRGITIEADVVESAVVIGDRAQLQQIALNLLQNAVDATESQLGEGKARKVRAAVEVDDDSVVFWVQDDGPGIDPRVLRRIFEPFFTTKKTGRGLGLATVFGLTQAHGGQVEATSPPGQGARFEVRLPRTHSGVSARAPAHLGPPTGQLTLSTPERPLEAADLDLPATTGPVPPPAMASTTTTAPTTALTTPTPTTTPGRVTLEARAQRVLVIDDDPMVRRATRRLLERLGHSVIEAANGEAGLEVSVDTYDLAVVDVTMPGLDGPTTLSRLRETRPALPAVIVTGRGDLVDATHVVLLKPFDHEALQGALNRAVSDAASITS